MSIRKRLSVSSSEDRLDSLITDRLQPGADRASIDKRIWDLFGEEWAIMFTDLSGFSRKVARFGIIHFLQTIHESKRILGPLIEKFDGILLKIEGDSFIVIFRNPVKAFTCAVSMHEALRKYNRTIPEEERVLLCVGLGFGKVLRIGETDVFGAEVNAASRLGEDVAKSYQIYVTENVKERIGDIRGLRFTRLKQPPSGAAAAYAVDYKDYAANNKSLR
jgi:adenylate cyclase